MRESHNLAKNNDNKTILVSSTANNLSTDLRMLRPVAIYEK